MTLHEFYEEVSLLKKRTGQRYGQSLMNLLDDVKPNLSKHIRKTGLVNDGLDPFYVKDGTALPLELFDYIETNWYFGTPD